MAFSVTCPKPCDGLLFRTDRAPSGQATGRERLVTRDAERKAPIKQMVPVEEVLAESLGRELERLGEKLRESWLWPSPDTGFAAYAFDRAREKGPFGIHALTLEDRDIARFDE